MKRFFLICLTAFLINSSSSIREVQAQSLVNGGKTNVLLDTALLSTVGLTLTGTSGTLPGDLGAGSVGFAINARNGTLPTTFAYAPGAFAPFSGTIEHSGSIFFNQPSAPIEIGNLTIGYDATRVGGARSGFFVRSNVGLLATLFDIENPSNLIAEANSLTIVGDLLVSAELAVILGNPIVTGIDVGDARVNATAIPEPAAGFLLLAMAGVWAARRRR